MIYIVQNCNYAAKYPGNFMSSLFYLDNYSDYKFIYIFPDYAKELYWVKDMISEGKIVCFKNKNSFYNVINDIINKYSVKIIHTHFYDFDEYKALHRVKMYNPNIKLILHHHGLFNYIPYSNSKNLFYKYVKNTYIKFHMIKADLKVKSDFHIFCGKGLEKIYKYSLLKPGVAIDNAIQFDRLNSHIDINSVKQKFGINNDKSVLLAFGYQFYIKGIDVLLDALSDIAVANNIVLCLVFASNEEKNIQLIIDKFGCIPTWLRILPPTDNVVEYYKISDVFVSPSREEGCCYSVIEAAYSGCRLIISDIPGLEHAQDIPGTFVFKTCQPDSLKKSILECCNDKSVYDNKQMVLSKYSIDKWSYRIVDLYKKLLNI